MAQLNQNKDDFESDDFEPDDFEVDKSTKSTQAQETQPSSGGLSGLLHKGYEKFMEPLLPEIDPSETITTYGANTPIIRDIWPGGVSIPSLKQIYNELIRPASSPAGLGLMGLEGLIGSRAGKLPGLAESTKTAEVSDIPLKPMETPAPRPQLALPPAPQEILNRPRFIAGPAGVAENKLHPIDIAPTSPRLGATDQGTILPRETEGISLVDPSYAAREGLSLGKPLPGEPPTTGRQFNLGDPNAPYQLPSAVKPSRFGPEAKPALDEVKIAEPIKTAVEEVIPKPGQAKVVKTFKDISPATSAFTSADQTLATREITKPIADTIITAQDKKQNWIASTERELSELSSGLSKQDRTILGQLIDGQPVEGANPELQLRAQQARVILDQVHDMFPEGATRAGENVGYLENYFTHIQNQPEDFKSSIDNILEHHFSPFKSGGEVSIPSKVGQEGIGDMFEKSTGHPSSPFVEERTGKSTSIKYDVNKVFPAYIESAAKVIFDKPAVEEATGMLKNVPDSNLKELATWYIKNYSRYDASQELHGAWNKWTNSIARTTARSLLGFNTGLQTLHLARVPANLWPELGSKYTLYGLKQIGKNPIQAWTEAAKLGLLQNEIRPFAFKTPLEKFDSISNFLSLADYIDKTAGYYGYKQKFLDMGVDPETASLRALRETKRVSQTSDPARSLMAFTPPSGGNPIAISAIKLGGQFKQVPVKIVEQYVRIGQKAMSDPKQAARLLAGVGLVLGANEGLRTFHLDPMHMIPTSIYGAFGDTVTRVTRALAKGDIQGALKETMLWATPGGKSLERQIKQGPSALQ